MEFEEKTISEREIFRGKVVRLRVDEVRLPDGSTSRREIVDHPGGACVLAVREGKVLLVRQYRYAYREELLEIPAGKLEEGEDPMCAAARELSEETGLSAGKMTLLRVLYPTPGYSSEKIYIYEAEELEEGARHPDAGEFLSAVSIPLEEAYAMADEGKIRDAKTLIALADYRLRHLR